MANLITVSHTVWAEQAYQRCPGVSQNAMEQALHQALKEFCDESSAWMVELWDFDTDNADAPKPFNNGNNSIYDLQSVLDAEWATNYPNYAGGDRTAAFSEYHIIKEYWPWEIAYIHVCSYYDAYEWSPDPTVEPQQATRFVYPVGTPARRSPTLTYSSAEGWPVSFSTYNERPGMLKLSQVVAQGTGGLVPWVSMTFRELRAAPTGVTPPTGGLNPTTPGDSPFAIPVVFQRNWYEPILDGMLSKLMSQQDKPYSNPTLGEYHSRRFRVAIAKCRDMGRRQLNNSGRTWRYPAWA